MTKLFLDIDGVINAIAPADEWHDYRTVPLQGAYGDRINYSPRMLHHLRSLDLAVTWTTAWTDAAPNIFAPIIRYGENRPWLEPLDGKIDYPTILWKREAVEKSVADDPCAFIWVDDEMRPEDREWARSRGGLALRPPLWDGITREQIELMREYVEHVRGLDS